MRSNTHTLSPPSTPAATPLAAVPGDNSVDIFTNDLGVVVITDEVTGELKGYNLLVGGGLGRSHGACAGVGVRGGGRDALRRVRTRSL
jgi:hypothetical protein